METGPKDGATVPTTDPTATARPPESDAGLQQALAHTQRENAALRAEVLRLLRVESNLTRENAALDHQSSAYRQLFELGKRCNRGLTRDEIAAALVQFTLYTVNLERCAVQLYDGERFRTVAADGYYDPADERAVQTFSPEPQEPWLLELQATAEPRLCTLPGNTTTPSAHDRGGDPIAGQFLLDEYAVLSLRDETDGKLLGFLVAGNSRKRATHHSRIGRGEPLLLSLQSLVELAAVTLRSATLRQALQAERAQLEARVVERTGELAEVNERLRVELKERQHSEGERAALWESVVRSQATRIAELSTPILPITDQILVMPLIGVMDPQRVAQLSATVLDGAVQRRARVVILDLTGVQSPDRGLAQALGKTAQALGLVGVRTLLSGIGSSLARILVTDGTPLASLSTSATLQAGIAEAMHIVQPQAAAGAPGRANPRLTRHRTTTPSRS